jgi:hypothetical protein
MAELVYAKNAASGVASLGQQLMHGVYENTGRGSKMDTIIEEIAKVKESIPKENTQSEVIDRLVAWVASQKPEKAEKVDYEKIRKSVERVVEEKVKGLAKEKPKKERKKRQKLDVSIIDEILLKELEDMAEKALIESMFK